MLYAYNKQALCIYTILLLCSKLGRDCMADIMLNSKATVPILSLPVSRRRSFLWTWPVQHSVFGVRIRLTMPSFQVHSGSLEEFITLLLPARQFLMSTGHDKNGKVLF